VEDLILTRWINYACPPNMQSLLFTYSVILSYHRYKPPTGKPCPWKACFQKHCTDFVGNRWCLLDNPENN